MSPEPPLSFNSERGNSKRVTALRHPLYSLGGVDTVSHWSRANPALNLRGSTRGSEADGANDHSDKGAQGSSALRGLLVERIGSDRIRGSAAERREMELEGMDREGEEELARGEPTYESVALHFPAMKRPREAVSVKDHPKDIGIAADLARSLGIDAPVLGEVREEYRSLRARLGEEADYLDPFRSAEAAAGVLLRG
jgi:hypothetical protein